MAHLRNHLRHAHKIEDTVSLSAAIQNKNHDNPNTEIQTHQESGHIGSVVLVPVPGKKKAVVEEDAPSVVQEEEEEEEDSRETVAVKIEISPQLPMPDTHEDESNEIDDDENDHLPQTRSRQKGLAVFKE